MEIYYTDNELYVEVTDVVNSKFVRKLKNRLDAILGSYSMNRVNIIIDNNERYDFSLIEELINDMDNKYHCVFVVK